MIKVTFYNPTTKYTIHTLYVFTNNYADLLILSKTQIVIDRNIILQG